MRLIAADISRVRLNCDCECLSRSSAASAALQPSQEMSDAGPKHRMTSPPQEVGMMLIYNKKIPASLASLNAL